MITLFLVGANSNANPRSDVSQSWALRSASWDSGTEVPHRAVAIVACHHGLWCLWNWPSKQLGQIPFLVFSRTRFRPVLSRRKRYLVTSLLWDKGYKVVTQVPQQNPKGSGLWVSLWITSIRGHFGHSCTWKNASVSNPMFSSPKTVISETSVLTQCFTMKRTLVWKSLSQILVLDLSLSSCAMPGKLNSRDKNRNGSD